MKENNYSIISIVLASFTVFLVWLTLITQLLAIITIVFAVVALFKIKKDGFGNKVIPKLALILALISLIVSLF